MSVIRGLYIIFIATIKKNKNNNHIKNMTYGHAFCINTTSFTVALITHVLSKQSTH